MTELEALIAIYNGMQAITALLAFSVGLFFAYLLHLKGIF